MADYKTLFVMGDIANGKTILGARFDTEQGMLAPLELSIILPDGHGSTYYLPLVAAKELRNAIGQWITGQEEERDKVLSALK